MKLEDLEKWYLFQIFCRPFCLTNFCLFLPGMIRLLYFLSSECLHICDISLAFAQSLKSVIFHCCLVTDNLNLNFFCSSDQAVYIDQMCAGMI